MAFTPTQEDQIRQYLDFAAGYYDLNSQFEGMLDKIGDNAVEKASVEAIMASIALVELTISSTGTSSDSRGPLKAITGDVEWYNITTSGSGSTVTAENYGKILLNRLATRFFGADHGLPLNYFSGGGRTNNEMLLG